MKAEYQVEDQVLKIYVPKELDHHVADKIRRESETLMQERQIRKVIFDFSDTEFMDSSGIGMVLGRVRRLRPLGGSVEAWQVGAAVYRILNMSGLESVITVKRREATWQK